MTWILRSRGDPTAPIAAEYECPVHGRFTLTVKRPAPDKMPCPVTVEIEHHCEDPPCMDCGFTQWQCLEMAPWRFPTPLGKVKAGEVSQGKVMEYPPDRVCLDTRPLAEGMPYAEWKAKQDNVTRDINLARHRSRRR